MAFFFDVEADKCKVLTPGPEYSFKEGSTLVAASEAKTAGALFNRESGVFLLPLEISFILKNN